LLELVGLEGEEARKRIEMVHGAPVYRLRGSLLPLVYLKRELGQAEDVCAQSAGGGGTLRNSLSIVVLQADGQRFGLLVDEISDTEEIVVKPLSKHLKHVNIYAGAAIMGDGKVALILDVLGLAQHAHVIEEGREHAFESESKHGQGAAERQPLLLFQHGSSGRMAIDLGAVARLEEFSVEAIEIAGDQEAVQYRGQIMPLVRLADTLGTRHALAAAQEGPLQVVVVHADGGRNVGLVVDRILDIVDETYALDRQTARRGTLGSAVIQRRVTDLVDVAGLIASAQAAG
jgi:two-component system chemotaxis sensor kinase CheA